MLIFTDRSWSYSVPAKKRMKNRMEVLVFLQLSFPVHNGFQRQLKEERICRDNILGWKSAAAVTKSNQYAVWVRMESSISQEIHQPQKDIQSAFRKGCDKPRPLLTSFTIMVLFSSPFSATATLPITRQTPYSYFSYFRTHDAGQDDFFR